MLDISYFSYSNAMRSLRRGNLSRKEAFVMQSSILEQEPLVRHAKRTSKYSPGLLKSKLRGSSSVVHVESGSRLGVLWEKGRVSLHLVNESR